STVQSRVVKCGIASSPVARSIAPDTISALIPARAVALSLMSTNRTRPDSSSASATSSSPRFEPPSGGASWAGPTESPSARAPAGEAREADVGERGERAPVGAHLLEGGQCGQEAGAVVRAYCGDVDPGEPLGGLPRRHPREGLAALVEGEQRDDRQVGDLLDRVDRVDELVEVVERLDHEQVGAPALEDLGLLGEQLLADARGR